MSEGSNSEYIPSKEERKRNRERARSGEPPSTAPPSSSDQQPSTASAASSGPEEPMVMEARGRNGTVHFDGHFVKITRTGFLARATVGKGEKRIPLASISAVQIKPPGAMMAGFIQFTLPGSNERRSSFGSQSRQAADDENSVLFTKPQMPAFLALRDAVEQAIVARSAPLPPAPAAVPNIAEQIQQLAALRDQGILNETEFETKKAELLARM